jgi:hypothetical protein
MSELDPCLLSANAPKFIMLVMNADIADRTKNDSLSRFLSAGLSAGI